MVLKKLSLITIFVSSLLCSNLSAMSSLDVWFSSKIGKSSSILWTALGVFNLTKQFANKDYSWQQSVVTGGSFALGFLGIYFACSSSPSVQNHQILIDPSKYRSRFSNKGMTICSDSALERICIPAGSPYIKLNGKKYRMGLKGDFYWIDNELRDCHNQPIECLRS